jgi:hypothetical protein
MDLEKQAVLESGTENITHKGERLFVCVPHSQMHLSACRGLTVVQQASEMPYI